LVDLGEEEQWGCPITSQHVVDDGCHYRVAEWAPVVEGGASPRALDCVGDEQAGCGPGWGQLGLASLQSSAGSPGKAQGVDERLLGDERGERRGRARRGW